MDSSLSTRLDMNADKDERVRAFYSPGTRASSDCLDDPDSDEMTQHS